MVEQWGTLPVHRSRFDPELSYKCVCVHALPSNRPAIHPEYIPISCLTFLGLESTAILIRILIKDEHE